MKSPHTHTHILDFKTTSEEIKANLSRYKSDSSLYLFKQNNSLGLANNESNTTTESSTTCTIRIKKKNSDQDKKWKGISRAIYIFLLD